MTDRLQQVSLQRDTVAYDDNARRRFVQEEFNKQLEKLSRDAYRLGQEDRGDKNQGIDELIRRHMREFNPKANPWETLRKLGNQEEIQEDLSLKYDQGKSSIDRGMSR